jgi:beta-galactosidase
MGHFTITGDHFSLNGQPYRLLSGALHYFRVVPEYWQDRLKKLKAMGLNTVETYIAWNQHEPRPGEFHFEGGLDVVRFIQQAQDLDLNVIIRPGPYICAEWDFGGLPAWLLADPNMRVRCFYPPYLAAVDRYLDALLPRLAPLQITQGGPIIAMQVENEYGYYGNDKTYLRYLEAAYLERGIEVLLFTSDGPKDEGLQAGGLKHLLKTANFGSSPVSAFKKLRQYQTEGPLMCAEFWNGWFDQWGVAHHTRPAEEAAAVLDEMLSAGASVNFYMFHGGTNFGLTSGANEAPNPYQATLTSYDYDAALNEAGDPTPKYHAFADVIRRHTGQEEPQPAFQPSPKMALAPFDLVESASLWDSLINQEPIERAAPEAMEILGYNTALILYRTQVDVSAGTRRLTVLGLHDRAQVFVNHQAAGVLEREHQQDSLEIEIPAGGATLDILVENMGRVNYGTGLMDRKGILQGVTLGEYQLFGWQIYPLELDNLSALPFAPAKTSQGPAFWRGRFETLLPADTFLALPGWNKGLAWVNGFCLGRYWSRGPQQTLYVPAPLLRQGQNELVVLDLHGVTAPCVEFRDQPELDRLAN